jgi:hypothetical protein
MEARRPSRKRPTWDPTHIIQGIKLRNTFALEVLGLIVAMVTLGVVIELVGPGLRWSVPRPPLLRLSQASDSMIARQMPRPNSEASMFANV